MDKNNYKETLGNIEAFVFDVDGVMTDGSVTVFPTGEFVRTMNVKDGYAMQLAVKRGLKVFVITGARDESVRIRLKRLGIKDVVLDVHEKMEKLEEFRDIYGIRFENMVYMGDDVPDIEPMKAVGLPCCPCDACSDVLAVSSYVSPYPGGRGCVRDIVEQVLKVQGKWHEEDFGTYKA